MSPLPQPESSSFSPVRPPPKGNEPSPVSSPHPMNQLSPSLSSCSHQPTTFQQDHHIPPWARRAPVPWVPTEPLPQPLRVRPAPECAPAWPCVVGGGLSVLFWGGRRVKLEPPCAFICPVSGACTQPPQGVEGRSLLPSGGNRKRREGVRRRQVCNVEDICRRLSKIRARENYL